MMTPALGFYYGGLIDNKNVINTIFLSFICMGLITVQWTLFGYSFAFGGPGSFWGSFSWAALNWQDVDKTDVNAFLTGNYLGRDLPSLGTFPLYTHAAFQCAFAVITPAIISGSIVGRMRFIPYCLFILIWATVVYDPLACWIWSENGWLRTLGGWPNGESMGYAPGTGGLAAGAIDFAGGTVVHISSATAGLAACIVLGKRVEWQANVRAKNPNIPFTVLGAGLLWVGWIGFNAGSATSANGVAGLALVNTNVATAAGMLGWVALDAMRGHVSVAGACTGTVVGLVAITPACGFISPGWATLLGFVAAAAVYGSQLLWRRFHAYMPDDTLEVFTCHGVGGITGAIWTGLFADSRFNNIDGSFYGNGIQICYQLAAIVTTMAWSFILTCVILLAMDFVLKMFGSGIRVTAEDQIIGMDQIAHGEDWEVAMTASQLINQLTAKDHNINGMNHHFDHGKLSLQYQPGVIGEKYGEKPVSVEMGLAPPLVHSSSVSTSQFEHTVTVKRETDSPNSPVTVPTDNGPQIDGKLV